jgi:8-oxo-dGTP pyrophosphatase MutT (NUDIX family)
MDMVFPRFFLADASDLTSDPDLFDPADAELSHLQWVPLPEVRSLNLPFITRIVLAELERHLPRTDAPDSVPFVSNDSIQRDVIWL